MANIIKKVSPLKFTFRDFGLFLLFAIIFWLPRGFKLDQFVATDETAWLFRSANFYYALGQRDFAATNLNSSPGVVTMWVGTAAFLIEYPEYRGLGQGLFPPYEFIRFLDFLELQSVNPWDILVTSRVIMVLLLTAVITTGFIIAKQLFGTLPALMGFLLIAFDPFFIALTRTAHLDAPMGSFILLSMLTFLIFLYKSKHNLWLFLSGFIAGIGILAKIPTLFCFPVVGLLLFLKFREDRKNGQFVNTGLKRYWGGLVKPLVLWGSALLLAIIIFWPAMWSSPLESIMWIIRTPTSIAASVYEISNNEVVPTSFLTAFNKVFSQLSNLDYLRYLRVYIWRTTPTALFGLLAALIAYKKQYNPFSDEPIRKSILGLLWFVLIYTAFITIIKKSSDKYYIPVHIMLDLIAGIGWVSLLNGMKNTDWFNKTRRLSYLILAGLVIYQLTIALISFPYYFSYYNPLLGGSRKAGETRFVGVGEGLDQVGEYLNLKPGAESMRVLSWYSIGCLSYFFDGETNFINFTNQWDQQGLLADSDYLVTYTNQWHRRLPEKLISTLEGIEPEHSIWINNIEYARIYDTNTLPQELFEPEEIPSPP
ncbi:MAG: phospholipid carrier-dependent glycosyltransferase [Chloroflexi bacterium]|nr:phospholipid carrier-dependent glycosyltransferase [Chloroflexota bacterium]